jgi:C-methyltransferase
MNVPSHRDLLGFPVVPPPGMTGAVMRFRALLRRVHRATAPPSIQVLEALFSLFENRVIGLLVELGIPEALDRPRTAAELATTTGVDADALDRVLRYAAGCGFLARDRSHRYRANGVTKRLRSDHPGSWRGWVDFASSDWFWAAWRRADSMVRDGRSGVEAAFGEEFFDFVNRAPAVADAFNRAMAAGATVQALALSTGLEWSGVSTVCDVGGGTGAALEYLLAANPGLHGVLFDLPDVVARAVEGLRRGPLAARCTVEGGSFFDDVPRGCDRYLCLAIVHDWDDDRAVDLLRTVGRAMQPDAELVVVETVLGRRPRGDFADASHLLMRVLASGRERSADELTDLLERAGLRLTQQVPLATGFFAFVSSPA